MRLTNNRTKRKIYISPLIKVWQALHVDESLLSNSLGPRDDYGGGGNGWGQGDVDGRTDYGGGGNGWNQGDADNRQDYGGGGSGWEQGDFGGREGYGNGGDGWS